jgi:hypothetical protein
LVVSDCDGECAAGAKLEAEVARLRETIKMMDARVAVVAANIEGRGISLALAGLRQVRQDARDALGDDGG